MSKVIELPAPDATHLQGAQAKKAMTVGAALAAITDSQRFAFSYLTGFAFVVTLALGGLFFVILHHLTKAGWSVAARRQMEWVAGLLPVAVVLFIPVAVLAQKIYVWWSLPPGEHLKNAAYLSPVPFYIRALVFFAAWSGLALGFARLSRRQDETGDVALTKKMQILSAPMMLVFAVTLTFAAFDWLMSLQPRWYSTIFGVYVFAGSVTGSLSLLAIVTILLQRIGVFKRVSTVEHRHDIGKLLFGFVVFWAYIGFSQFVLQWYANLPEEIIFYKNRWVGSWKQISLLLLFGHFIVPFLFLLPRTTKRSMAGLLAGATLMLAMHYVDMYWLVMPIASPGGFSPSWIDLAGLLAPVGVLVLVIAYRAAKGPIYPLKDPRLAESLKLDN
jgi:hypothetical protein